MVCGSQTSIKVWGVKRTRDDKSQKSGLHSSVGEISLMSQPFYLIIGSKASYRLFQRFCESNPAALKQAIAFEGMHNVAALESGTCPEHMLVVSCKSQEDAKQIWQDFNIDLLTNYSPPLALLAPGIPPSGLPAEFDFLPTLKNVGSRGFERPALMLIDGSVTEEEPIDRYRDIIMPMLKERGAYYLVYTLSDDVTILSGEWREQFLALSRWPSRHLALGFWLSDQYQEKAIPCRKDAGHFGVHLFDGKLD